jgi:RimJ/RimL family protein N-acetyltransferase
VATAAAASFADLTPTLQGRAVRIEPLRADHEAGLRAAAADPRVWRWMPIDPTGSDESFHSWMADALERAAAGLDAPFSVLSADGGQVLGSTRYLALRPEHRSLEIGWTWLSPAAWGTGANAEAKLLLLEHAFERLGCMRVEFKTDAKNERSRAALEAIGARFEGIHRKHMLVRGGELRDSAWYSVIDDDWPATKAALADRVARKEAG